MIHHTNVTGIWMSHEDHLTVHIQVERLPQGDVAPDPPRAVDLPPDVVDALRAFLDPMGDQP